MVHRPLSEGALTNQEIQNVLKEYPLTAVVEMKTAQGIAVIERIEWNINPALIPLTDQNLSWIDRVQRALQVRLVAGVIYPEK